VRRVKCGQKDKRQSEISQKTLADGYCGFISLFHKAKSHYLRDGIIRSVQGGKGWVYLDSVFLRCFLSWSMRIMSWPQYFQKKSNNFLAYYGKFFNFYKIITSIFTIYYVIYYVNNIKKIKTFIICVKQVSKMFKQSCCSFGYYLAQPAQRC